MIQAPSARGKVRFVSFLAASVTAVAVAVACAPSQRANGQGCLKDSDCLSGVCVQAFCAAAPTLLDAEVNGEGGTADGTTGDTGSASEAASPEGAAESGSGGGETGAAETGATDSGSSDSSLE